MTEQSTSTEPDGEAKTQPDTDSVTQSTTEAETGMGTKTKTKSRRATIWLVGGVLVFLFFGCLIMSIPALWLATRDNSPPQTGSVSPGTVQTAPKPVTLPSTHVVIATPEGGIDYETAVLASIYHQVNPSVVNVSIFERADKFDPSMMPPDIDPEDLLFISSGSGFVWDTFGHIVTNDHVVDEADQIQITFADGTISVAEVVGIDDDSDLAVVRIDPEGYYLAPITVGSMDDVEVGMRVAAIGNAFGLEGTMTTGIVSAVGRSIGAINGFSIPDSIQTDAAINPGNSGGPLLNERGELIGVNAQIHSEVRANSGVGFAIPVSIVERVVPALIANGEYAHSYMGISGGTLSPICADELDLPKTLHGALVGDVLDETPAEKAGFRGSDISVDSDYPDICPHYAGGDVIIAIGDVPVTSFDDVLSYLVLYTSPGDTISVMVWRDGKTKVLDMTLTERPERAIE